MWMWKLKQMQLKEWKKMADIKSMVFKVALIVSAVSAVGLISRSAFAFGPPLELLGEATSPAGQSPAGLDAVMKELAAIRSHLDASSVQPQCNGTMTAAGCIGNYNASFMLQGMQGGPTTGASIDMTSGMRVDNWVQAAFQSATLSPFYQIHVHNNYYLPPILFPGPQSWSGSADEEKSDAHLLEIEEDESDQEQPAIRGLIAT